MAGPSGPAIFAFASSSRRSLAVAPRRPRLFTRARLSIRPLATRLYRYTGRLCRERTDDAHAHAHARDRCPRPLRAPESRLAADPRYLRVVIIVAVMLLAYGYAVAVERRL